ncbi:type VII secretion system-associated protein [Micromonospora haikouensis]|uniref:type VII secretion system-associated protein n=1 Tax=Micromonospora haikouensis TaxID=686309 RepID=UPI0007C68BAB
MPPTREAAEMQPELPHDAAHYFLLMDPAWEPEPGEEVPPLEVVVGGWPVTDGGDIGAFRANPGYVPSDENAPTDPLDAVLRLVMSHRADAEQLQLVLRDSVLDIGMDGDGRPLVARSPDGVPCVVVATGPAHRARSAPPAWRRGDLDDLVTLLVDGVDVLVNPGGPAATRLTGEFVRETVLMTDAEVSAAAGRCLRADDRVAVVRWDTPPADGDAARPGGGAQPAAPTPTGAPDDGSTPERHSGELVPDRNPIPAYRS